MDRDCSVLNRANRSERTGANTETSPRVWIHTPHSTEQTELEVLHASLMRIKYCCISCRTLGRLMTIASGRRSTCRTKRGPTWLVRTVIDFAGIPIFSTVFALIMLACKDLVSQPTDLSDVWDHKLQALRLFRRTTQMPIKELSATSRSVKWASVCWQARHRIAILQETIMANWLLQN